MIGDISITTSVYQIVKKVRAAVYGDGNGEKIGGDGASLGWRGQGEN